MGYVAPLAGAWIEIEKIILIKYQNGVAPLAGAWIEIYDDNSAVNSEESLLSRERGLKSTGKWVQEARHMSLLSRERGLKYTMSH